MPSPPAVSLVSSSVLTSYRKYDYLTFFVPMKKATKIAMPTKTQRDKHKLYQQSVQDPDSEARLILRVFRKLRKRSPRTLREDFCGTALLASTWVQMVPDGSATGIDLHRPTLDYARRVNVSRLGTASKRVELIEGDVLEDRGDTHDVIVAFNFSYFVFKDRDLLRRYFERVHNAVADDGIFFLDLYGGPEAQVLQEESTDHDDFTYVWDQARFNPITGETLCHIHFDFPDGSRMNRAFTYDWRLWSLPEVQDLLSEVGFRKVEVYWEGTDSDGEGNGVFRRSRRGDDSSCWVAYIVATK